MFSLSAATFAPRLLRQHPSTNQNTLTVARGPLIYCAEDADNNWVDDHFKSVRIPLSANLEEKSAKDDILDEAYMAVVASGVKFDASSYDKLNGAFPGLSIDQTTTLKREDVKVTFVPYYYRGNRGGRGHMRVGFKTAESIL